MELQPSARSERLLDRALRQLMSEGDSVASGVQQAGVQAFVQIGERSMCFDEPELGLRMAEGNEIESVLRALAEAGDSREHRIADRRRNLSGAALDDFTDEERVASGQTVQSLSVPGVVRGDA